MPAAAVETLYLQGPLGLQRLSVNLQELSSPEALWSGSSDLAELNRATDGRLGRSLQTLLTTPLPLPVQLGLDNPMARQVEMLVQSLVEPAERQWQPQWCKPARHCRGCAKPLPAVSRSPC